MMRDGYLNEVVRRGNELNALERAALYDPGRTNLIRWAVGAAFGLLVTLLPAVCSARELLLMI